MASFEKIKTPSLVDTAYEVVRKAILVGDLQPGERISEIAVAREMGTSRAPIREALRLLERSGLVQQQKNKGYWVSQFTENDFFELASLRFSLEALAVRLSIKSTELIGELEILLDGIRDAEESADPIEAVRLDRRFHEAILVASGHGRLRKTWSGLRDEIELAVANANRSYPTLHGLSDTHVPILDAIRDGDEARAVKELEKHILNSPLAARNTNATS